MDKLTLIGGEETLTPTEQQALDQLLNEYEQIVLTRAQAALLLKQRDYDVADPAVLTEPPLTP